MTSNQDLEDADTDNLLNYNYSPEKKSQQYGAVNSPQVTPPSTLYPNIQDEPQVSLNNLLSQRQRFRSQISSISSFVSPNEEVYFTAAVLIEDAMLYRSIYHRLSYTALRIYKIYQSTLIQYLITLCIFVNLALAFFENPSSISVTSDYRSNDTSTRLEPPCGLTESIEIVTLLIFLVDYIVTVYQVGWRTALTKIWLHLYIFSIVFSFIDVTVSLGLLRVRNAGNALIPCFWFRRCRELYWTA